MSFVVGLFQWLVQLLTVYNNSSNNNDDDDNNTCDDEPTKTKTISFTNKSPVLCLLLDDDGLCFLHDDLPEESQTTTNTIYPGKKLCFNGVKQGTQISVRSFNNELVYHPESGLPLTHKVTANNNDFVIPEKSYTKQEVQRIKAKNGIKTDGLPPLNLRIVSDQTPGKHDHFRHDNRFDNKIPPTPFTGPKLRLHYGTTPPKPTPTTSTTPTTPTVLASLASNVGGLFGLSKTKDDDKKEDEDGEVV